MRSFTVQLFTIIISIVVANNFIMAQKRPYIPSEINKAYNYFENGDIADAIHDLRSVVNKYPKLAEAHFWLARSYQLTPDKELAIKHFMSAYEIKPNVSPDILYWLGVGYHSNMQFDEAEMYYDKYEKILDEKIADKLGVSLLDEKVKVHRRIYECQNAKLFYYNAFKHDIELLNEYVNSIHPDYTPIVTADNKTLYFTSRRPGGTGTKKDKDNMLFEDIWMSHKMSNGDWSVPSNLGKPINTESHDAAIAISPDGLELFFYKTNNGGDIYYSNKTGNTWSEPQPLSKTINTKFKEPSITISKDKKTVYFSSNKPGGFGGLDIYKSTLLDNGEWDEPVNLGTSINSESDEDAPFLDTDGQTLYFSSNGHNTMGGYDIFMTRFNKKTNTYNKPLNLGYPINSPEDDIYFAIAGDHKTAYYASAQKDGYGKKDLYQVKLDSSYFYNPLPELADNYRIKTFSQVHTRAVDEKSIYEYALAKISGEKKSTKITDGKLNMPKNVAKTTVKGKIVDSKSKTGIPVKILVKPVNSEHIVYTYMSKPDGSFEIALPDGSDYALDFEKEGYLFESQNIDLLHVRKNQNLIETIEMHKPEKGEKIVLRNVFFESGDASLDPDSFEELDYLFSFLQKNKNIKIEISGHTDNKGSAIINQELSERRAQVIHRYLANKGLDASRIRTKGYGSNRPVASNDTEEGKRLNRRTEFEIVD
ncbi:MAG: OmpA family protein [Bacteroidota bacterium]|nr:OmpA family protein [Bacteroidota bacterium]